MFNFEHLNKTLTEKMIESSTIETDNSMIIYEILFREIDVSDIDFDSFTLEEIINLEDDFGVYLDFIDDDAADDIFVTDQHWFAVLDSLGDTVSKLNNLPKLRPKSQFKFI